MRGEMLAKRVSVPADIDGKTLSLEDVETIPVDEVDAKLGGFVYLSILRDRGLATHTGYPTDFPDQLIFHEGERVSRHAVQTPRTTPGMDGGTPQRVAGGDRR